MSTSNIGLIDQLARVRDQLKEIDALAHVASSPDFVDRDDPVAHILNVIAKLSDLSDVESVLNKLVAAQLAG